MRLRIMFAALLFAPQQIVAYKQIGLWSDTLNSHAEKKIRTKADGATASGFFRSNKMMQPDSKAKKLLKRKEDTAETTVWTKFCGIARAFDWLLWVLIGIVIEKKDDKPFFATVVLVRVIGLLMVDACAAAFGFFRPNTMMQPNDTCKAEELLKGNKDIAEATAWTKFCGIARDFDCLLWVLLGIIIEKS